MLSLFVVTFYRVDEDRSLLALVQLAELISISLLSGFDIFWDFWYALVLVQLAELISISLLSGFDIFRDFWYALALVQLAELISISLLSGFDLFWYTIPAGILFQLSSIKVDSVLRLKSVLTIQLRYGGGG